MQGSQQQQQQSLNTPTSTTSSSPGKSYTTKENQTNTNNSYHRHDENNKLVDCNNQYGAGGSGGGGGGFDRNPVDNEDPKNVIRPPTKEDPYYRNGLGQFSRRPPLSPEPNNNNNNNNNNDGEKITQCETDNLCGLRTNQQILFSKSPTQINETTCTTKLDYNIAPSQHPSLLGQSAASMIAEAVRGQGLMPSSDGTIGGQGQHQQPTSNGGDGGDRSSHIPSQVNTTNHTGLASASQKMSTDQSMMVGGNASSGNDFSSNSHQHSTNGATSKPQSGVSSSGSNNDSNKKVSIPKQEYSQFLDIKSQHEALLREKEEMEKKQKEMAEKLKEWENIGSTIGGSSNLEASQRVVQDLKRKEINKFMEKLNEIMPELDQVYKEAEGAEKTSIEPVIKTLKTFQLNADQLEDPKKLEGARGLVEIVTKASRNYNTRFTEKEAEIKELQRKYAEKQRELEEAKKREEELAQKAALYSKTTGGFSSERKSIEPTIIGSDKENGRSSLNNNNNNNNNGTTIHTTASSGNNMSRRTSDNSAGGNDRLYPSNNPLDCPPGFESGYTVREYLSGSVNNGGSGGLATINTTASSSYGNGWGGTTPQEYQRERQLATRSVNVEHESAGNVEIEFRPWNPKTQGHFSRFGPDYIGNKTFDWIESCIRNNTLNDVPVFMTPGKSDMLMTVEDAVRQGALKRPRYW